MRHVVVDTNCLLRMIPIHGRYRQVWEAFLSEKYAICVSNEIIFEYMEILSQKVSATFAANIVGAILKSNCVKLISPSFHFNLITQDPDDNKFVDCAIIANANFIVSDDSHFKALENIPFPKVTVITLEQFQKELS
ncbi:MAG: putative toxin-antitoxin system toxin component, PIN family [Bacteroidales bacterium]|nr:putative toxin-antitoxin system toxin component, PIN family [Bacteroidales bacterium]MBR4339200.1 putative toxin-antitoxin system toxin component, PIN family [Bacteroidales bacterium]MBR4511214.1 putative toxin-antitoxin system toxin component, PIN family [Bacteroidales bacterium]MBR6918975.1 putative toxin-antitoxin system toxin component, PIN family [Bacteroidales bacterium]